MIDGLVSGKLYGKPVCRTGNGGRQFVTAKVRAATSADEAIFVNVIAFGNTAKDALLELDDGDSVAISGTLTPKAWIKDGEARPSLDCVASVVLSVYHVRRKRAAMQADGKPAKQAGEPAMADDRLDDF